MLYAPKSVEDAPVCNLRHWRVIKILQEDTHHFSGMTDDAGAGPGRVSSRIDSYSAAKKEGRTSSGRIYKLIGPPRPPEARTTDADWVLDQWLRGALYHDVTELYI